MLKYHILNAMMILRICISCFQRAVGWCETADDAYSVSYRSRTSENCSMKFRNDTVISQGYVCIHKVVLTKDNSGGTAVFVNRPAELSYTALRFFITFSLYFNLPTKREKVGIL